jgi:hypothetical protein
LYGTILKYGRTVGSFNPNGKLISTRIILFGLYCLLFQGFCINGVIHEWPNMISVFIVIPYFLLSIQGFIRLTSRYFRNHEQLMENLNKKIKEAFDYGEKRDEFLEICSSSVRISENAIKLLRISYVIIYLTVYIAPFVLSAQKNKLILFQPYRIPFIDPHSLWGYLIHLICGAILEIIGFLFFSTVESLNIFFGLQIIVIGNVFVQRLKNYAVELTNKSVLFNNQRKMDQEQQKEFIQLIKIFYEYEDYISDFLEMSKIYAFSVISFGAIAIGFHGFIALKFSILSGFVGICGILVQIFIQCATGAVMMHQKNKIIDAVCGFPWYYLPRTDQKVFLQFIHLCQNATEFELPIIGAINMELFTNILNASYSYLMGIYNFVK